MSSVYASSYDTLNTVNIDFIDSNVVNNIKSYIKDIKSISMDFTQSDSKGHRATGILIIDKPYKFRCNYDYPFPLLIVGNKNYVYVYDYEMQSLSRIGAKENILYFLLVDDTIYDNKFEIVFAKNVENKNILELFYKDLDRRSQVTFNNSTGHLESLKIFENDNIITLEFYNVHNIKDVSRDLFIVKEPTIYGNLTRLDRANLRKKYHLK